MRHTRLKQKQEAQRTSQRLGYCIETFGPDRCMFESNFPVDKQGCSYTVLFNAFQRIWDEAGYTAAERADLFAGTARRFYRLEPPARAHR